MNALVWLYEKLHPNEVVYCNDADEALAKEEEKEKFDKILSKEVKSVAERARRARERNGFGKALVEALRGKK